MRFCWWGELASWSSQFSADWRRRRGFRIDGTDVVPIWKVLRSQVEVFVVVAETVEKYRGPAFDVFEGSADLDVVELLGLVAESAFALPSK